MVLIDWAFVHIDVKNSEVGAISRRDMKLSNIDNVSEYHEYMILYGDDCLCISQHPGKALERLGKYFTLKPG